MQSDHLTIAQCFEILSTAESAIESGMPFNRFTTIHFESQGVEDREVVGLLGKIMDRTRKLARRKNVEFAYLYVRENDRGDGSKGSHVHIMWHLPDELARPLLRGYLRKWLAELSGRPVRRKVVNTRSIGRTVCECQTNPRAYRKNLTEVTDYLLKGVERDTARVLGLKRWGHGGVVLGKRWGRSQNLNLSN